MKNLFRPHAPLPAAALLLMLAGCAQLPGGRGGAAPEPATAAPPPASMAAAAAAPAPVGVLELMARPAEQALLAGLRAYDDGQYPLAERRLTAALKAGLAAPKDRVAAHKTLAFVYCSSKRIKACEDEFRAAAEADPEFALTKAEAGHPAWGPVYRRIATP
ncbi:MAG TPA: TssQ family T6SS-associated lipoprotein [Methylibium sp.]|nr:TssQ family T6SS-associated lipoprotein [Methylibium sp.]